MESTERIGRFVAFATIGTLNVTQHLAAAVLHDIANSDPDLVAEETLCLVSTATSRAADIALREAPELARGASAALFDIPFSYRDYLIGGEMLDSPNGAPPDSAEQVYARLQRKREFYSVHLVKGRFPGEGVLTEKMGLWMGRVSPPGLPETPTTRLEKLRLVAPLVTHLKLVVAYGRQPPPS